MRISFIDVGQGDAALVEFPDGTTMVIDAGPKTEEYDAGKRIVAPFLKRRGISTIDYLVATHPHADHIGGIAHLLDEFEVREVIESGQPARDRMFREYARAIAAEGCTITIARAMDSVTALGGARLYLLYPTTTFIDPDTTRRHPNLNNTSVVFKLCFGETSVLFTGDAEHEAESEMVSLFGDFLQATILKAGHHGSKTSSTPSFINAVQPRYAIISVGLHNTFNHPSEDVITQFHELNVEVLRTDEEGAIVFESDGTTMQRLHWR